MGWSDFVEAVELCIRPRIDLEEIDLIRDLLIKFYNHYARLNHFLLLLYILYLSIYYLYYL
jgi:hypothetical protein